MTSSNKAIRISAAAILYVHAKQERTACLQKNFRQRCHYCPYFFGCKLYAEYVDKWMKLERAVNE